MKRLRFQSGPGGRARRGRRHPSFEPLERRLVLSDSSPGSLAARSGWAAAEVAQAPTTESPETTAPAPLTEPVPPNGQAQSAPAATSIAPNLSLPILPSFSVYRDTVLGAATGGKTSEIGEPNVGSIGGAVFVTGNWYAAISGDHGSTFGFINPYTEFPTTGAFRGGFASDQRVVAVPSRDMLVWYLQYQPTGTTGADTNGVRIAVAQSSTNLRSNSWHYYDLTPANFNLGSGVAFDYPHMEASSNYLYVTSNIIDTSGDQYLKSIMYRIPLSELKSGGNIGWDSWIVTSGSSLALTSGAQGTMYAGAQLTSGSGSISTAVRVYTQNESDTQLTYTDVTALNPTYLGTPVASSPDGNNWAGFGDSRIQTAWVSAGIIGMMWDSAQGTNRPQPFVRALDINALSKQLIGQTDLWSTSTAYQYPSMAANSAGQVAGVVYASSATQAPEVVILTGYDSRIGWGTLVAVSGTNAARYRWGDYIGVEPDDQDPGTWIAAAYVLDGPSNEAARNVESSSPNPNIRVHFLWFGKTPVNPYSLIAPGQVGAVSAGPDSAARPSVFVVGLDRQVWAQGVDTLGNSTGNYYLTAPGQVKAVAATTDGLGRSEDFVIGLDNQVWAHKFDADGNSLGGYGLTAPGQVKALAVTRGGSLGAELFVIGLDDQVWAHRLNTSGDPVGGYFLTAPGRVKALSVGYDSSGNAMVFVIGLDDQVWVQKFNSSGASLGGYTLVAPGKVLALAANPASTTLGGPDVFVIGLDHQVWSHGAGYSLVAPGQVQSISAGRDFLGDPLIYAVGLDAQVYLHTVSLTIGDFGPGASSNSVLTAGQVSPEAFSLAPGPAAFSTRLTTIRAHSHHRDVHPRRRRHKHRPPQAALEPHFTVAGEHPDQLRKRHLSI